METTIKTTLDLRSKLAALPNDASPSIVGYNFIFYFLEALGFNRQNEIYAEFNTGNGTVDYAVRKNTDTDNFLVTQSNPYLILEAKGRDLNLSENTRDYKQTIRQLKNYLLADNCQTAKWGIITNSKYIQLFRKHGKVIHPASKLIPLTIDNINDITDQIKNQIWNYSKALTIAIYNNKGGVGKTTTTVNLAAVLGLPFASLSQKVLAIDFDSQQRDLTTSLGISTTQEKLYNVLLNQDKDIRKVITKRDFRLNSKGVAVDFDVIPAHEELVKYSKQEYRKHMTVKRFQQVLEPVRAEYDYILIDTPPNRNFFSESAMYAADVILIPTKHNNVFSLKNAAITIKNFIPDIQQIRQDGGPIALPIFFNGEKIVPAEKNIANQAIEKIIKEARRESFDLLPYFYPKYKPATKDTYIFELPNYALIATAAFSHKPGVYKHKAIFDSYYQLAKEYFLQ